MILSDFYNSIRSTKTERQYTTSLSQFFAFSDLTADAFLSLERGDATYQVIKFRNFLRKQKKSSSTINARLSAIRSLISFADSINRINWKLSVKNERTTPCRNTDGPTTTELRELVSSVQAQQTNSAVRNLAILSLLIEHGFRRFEVSGLDIKHVNLKKGNVSVLRKNKQKRHLIKLSENSKQHLAAWIELRNTKTGPLFVSFRKNGRMTENKLSGRSIYSIVKEHSGDAITPHKVRHSVITEKIHSGWNIDDVRRYAGHKSIATTGQYFDLVSDPTKSMADQSTELYW